jgi:hypothetical protein
MLRPPASGAGDRGTRRSTLRTVVVALLLVGTLAGPALASPQPDAVCDVCGEKYERAATELGVNVTVTHSTAEVRLYANGTTAWVVHNRLTPESADRLRESPNGPETVTRAAFETYPAGPVDDPTSVATVFDDRTVTIRYRDDAPVSQSFGVTVLEYFDTNGYDYWYVVNADELRVVGPEGTHVTNHPANADVDGRTVTWRGDSSELWGGTDLYDGDGRIAFADADASAPALRTTGALWADTLPIYLDNLRSFLVPTVLVAGVLSLAGLGVVRRVSDRIVPRQAGRAIGAVGTVGAVVAVGAGVATDALGNAGWWVAGATVFATAGWVTAERPAWVETPGRAAVTGLGSCVVGVLAATPVFVFAGPPGGRPLLGGLARILVILLPLGLAPAAGLLAGRAGHRSLLAGWGALLATFTVAAASVIPVATRPFGLLIFVLLIGALVGAVLATPLAALGAGVAARRAG